MKMTSVIILDEDLGEEDEVGGGGDAVEDVVVAVEVMAMAMAPHLTPLPENLAMNEENLMVPREGWQVGTALGSRGGVGLSGEWSLLERDEVFLSEPFC